MASATATIDHDEIRDWVESRGGYPARVKRTGILRIDYPGYSGAKTLERIDWDDWFEAFDDNKLAFLYQAGGRSKFSKLVDRSTVELPAKKRAATKRKTTAKRATAKRSSAKRSTAKRSTAKRASASGKTSPRKASTTRSASSSNRTTDHKAIRRWVEERGGWPATVKSTKRRGDAGLLRIDYPGYSGKGTLERIDWSDFFKKFDKEKLAFLYQDKKNSRFSKLVRR